jgi:hypothetical protein
MSNSKQTAETILAQLGGRRFIVMTGAKNFLALESGALRFTLPARFARDGINLVEIALNGRDLYDVTFMRYNVRAREAVKTIATESDIYCDMLRECFTRATGLHTSL